MLPASSFSGPTVNSEVCSSHIVLVRHGVSEHNKAFQIIKPDGKIVYNYKFNSNPKHNNYFPSNLLNEGREKVAETAKKLNDFGIDAINSIAFVSPLPRTHQSAEILMQHGVIGDTYITDERIIEAQAGDLENEFGLYPETLEKRSRTEKDAKNYETKEILSQRVKEFTLSLQDSLSKANHKNVIVVSHDAVLEMFVQLFGLNYDYMAPGSYLRYDLTFHSNETNKLGILTPFQK